MARVTFLGRVFPIVLNVSCGFSENAEITWNWPEMELDLHFKTYINLSSVKVQCDFDGDYREEYFNEFYKRSIDLARAVVNLVAFSTGCGLTVVLEKFIRTDGSSSPIILKDEALAAHCTSYALSPDRIKDLSAVMQIVLTDTAIFRLLNDLIEAITLTHVAPVHCGRVIDGINRIISPGEDRKKAWSLMRRALNLSQTYLELISKHATGPRHGDPAFISGKDVAEVTRRTWVIMNRFLEYRKQGNQQLKAPEFPNL